jgi:hypothetical protein
MLPAWPCWTGPVPASIAEPADAVVVAHCGAATPRLIWPLPATTVADPAPLGAHNHTIRRDFALEDGQRRHHATGLEPCPGRLDHARAPGSAIRRLRRSCQPDGCDIAITPHRHRPQCARLRVYGLRAADPARQAGWRRKLPWQTGSCSALRTRRGPPVPHGLAEPGERPSHLTLVSLEGDVEPYDATVLTDRDRARTSR